MGFRSAVDEHRGERVSRAQESLSSESLYGALVRLQGAEGRDTLWIDGSCIDQGNLNKRSAQARTIDYVYGKARGMIIWLGESVNDSDLAIRLIRN
jgi:hypothetical protein